MEILILILVASEASGHRLLLIIPTVVTIPAIPITAIILVILVLTAIGIGKKKGNYLSPFFLDFKRRKNLKKNLKK